MFDAQKIITQLKTAGFRQTQLRTALIGVFAAKHAPLDYIDITRALREKNLSPNKTSIYRELDFLLGQSLIQEIDLGEGKKRYEVLDHDDHHHHLVCEKCHSIDDIHLGEDLVQEEQAIFLNKKFLVKKHMLEFFGLCHKCQQKG